MSSTGDETDGKSYTGSVLAAVSEAVRNVLPGSHKQQKKTKKYKPRKKQANVDSALPSDDSDSSYEQYSLAFRECITKERSTQLSGSKAPPGGISVSIMSPRSRQGDGLLQVSNSAIGTYKSNPVYSVDFTGKQGDSSTFLVWYPLSYDETQTQMKVYLHVLDPADRSTSKGSQSDIPRENFTYRLSWFKKDDQCILAAQKAQKATGPFSDDEGSLDLVYHASKGGAITVSLDADRLLGTSANGDITLVKESAFWENPYSLFYIYDDGCIPKGSR